VTIKLATAAEMLKSLAARDIPTIRFRVSTTTAPRPSADLPSESLLAGILSAAKRRRNSAKGERSEPWVSELPAPFQGLSIGGRFPQGSALRLHPGINSYAASRLDYSEAFPRLFRRADAKEVAPQEHALPRGARVVYNLTGLAGVIEGR
jgi:hypothetical protein